jgi:pimeloyl-ACP methyl ester carboxylesterase
MDGFSSRQSDIVKLLGVALLSVLITGCAAYPGEIVRERLSADALAALDAEEALGRRWLSREQPRAVVVLVHGLNLDPAAMTDIAAALYTSGMDVLSVSLSGHAREIPEDGRLLQFQEADFSSWQRDVRDAVAVAHDRAARFDIPLHLVGFSLGGLLSADYLLHGDGIEISRMVLFAPAISLKWSSYLLYPMQVLPGVFLPSVAPQAYRANDFAPVSAYLALYEGVRQFNEAAGQQLNIPTLVFMHPRDELVSASRIRDFIQTHALSEWRYVEVRKSDGAANVLDHLIISEDSVGTDAWRLISRQMLDFLR